MSKRKNFSRNSGEKFSIWTGDGAREARNRSHQGQKANFPDRKFHLFGNGYFFGIKVTFPSKDRGGTHH